MTPKMPANYDAWRTHLPSEDDHLPDRQEQEDARDEAAEARADAEIDREL